MMVKDLSGWLDYDRDKLPSLSPAERIDYFEKRVRKVAVNPLRRILTTEIIVEGYRAKDEKQNGQSAVGCGRWWQDLALYPNEIQADEGNQEDMRVQIIS